MTISTTFHLETYQEHYSHVLIYYLSYLSISPKQSPLLLLCIILSLSIFLLVNYLVPKTSLFHKIHDTTLQSHQTPIPFSTAWNIPKCTKLLSDMITWKLVFSFSTLTIPH